MKYILKLRPLFSVRRGLMIACVAILFFSSYKVVVYAIDLQENQKTNADTRAIYYNEELSLKSNPTDLLHQMTASHENGYVERPAIQEKFIPLLQINSDTVGWIRIKETPVDYPVVKTSDNDYYLNHDINKRENAAGTIFMDYRNKVDDDRNLILYGHNMKDGSMFAEILRYESRWFFDNHPTIQFDTIYGNKTWEIFSVYTTDTKFNYLQTEFSSKDKYKEFLKMIQSKSIHEKYIEMTENEHIITLSTCSYAFKDARFVVHARLIDP